MFFNDLWYKIVNTVRTFEPADAVDIIIVAYLIYSAIKLVRETRAAQLVKGIFALLALNLFASWLGLRTMSYIMTNILGVGIFVLVVLFQPELRRALEQVGRTSFTNFNVFPPGLRNEQDGSEQWKIAIETICNACESLSRDRTGALIVIERQTRLGEIIKTGTKIDAQPSEELIGNIFFVNSPLHDGAMIIREGRLYAAGCYLPLSDNFEISRDLGTRHRAALGMSESSDAIIVVVSEETGIITVAMAGKIKRNFTSALLSAHLTSELISEKPEPSEKKQKTRRSKK